MRGEISSDAVSKRHPYDWYVEEQWVTVQLVQALGGLQAEKAAGLGIWDPCAGYGHIGSAVEQFGFAGRIYLGDIVCNVAWDDFEQRPHFQGGDFLEVKRDPAFCSIITNPPYSYRKGFAEYSWMLISEAIVRHALKLSSMRVCALLPSKWLASQARYALFTEHPPIAVLHLTQRPSMPPGDRIEAMGNRAYRGGMTDYCWIVWDKRKALLPGDTRTVWLPPRGRSIRPIPELAQ